MKRVLLVLVFFISFSAASLSAWEANDLTKYPPCMTASNWILNLGVGINPDWLDSIGEDYYWLPAFRLSFDKNTPIGDKKLPFFFGGLIGYTGYGFNHSDYGWHHHQIPLGFRIGYHFNWGVDGLDTYAVTTIGYTFGFTDNKDIEYNRKFSDDFFTYFNIGARWFISKGFGFWLEAGLHPFLILSHPRDAFGLDIGLAFKF